MTAVDATLAQRATTYGPFSEVARVSQAIQDAIASGPAYAHMDPDAREALQLIASKIARLTCGDPRHVDSWHDIGGYARLVEVRLTAPVVGAPVPPAETALPPAGFETEYRPSELDYPGTPWRARRAGAALWFRGQTQKEALEHAGAVDPR